MATDHEDIYKAVQAFGGRAEMTDPHAASGTDRVAEVARRMAGRRNHRQRPGRRARDRRQFDRSGDRTSRCAPRGPDVDAGHAHPQPAAIGRPGLREGGVRPPGPGPVLQPQPHSAGPRVGRRPAGGRPAALLSARRAIRLSPRFSLETRRHAAFQPGDRWKNSNNSACCKRATPILVGVVDEPTFGIDTPEDYRAFVEKKRRQSMQSRVAFRGDAGDTA